MNDRDTIVESAVYPSKYFLESNGELRDQYPGGEAAYDYNGQSWYVRWDGTVAPLVDDVEEV